MSGDGRARRDDLLSLSVRYARAVDRGEADAFVDLFTPDAVLTVHNPAGADPASTYRGREDLTRIPKRMARFRATYHFVGQAHFDLDADEPTGEVHCMAHHLSGEAGGSSDYVMLIRYDDHYRCHEGQWRIAERRVLVDWTETRPANPPGT